MKRGTLLFSLVTVAMALIVGVITAQDGEPVAVAPSSEDIMKANIIFVGAHPDDDSIATATMARYTLDRGVTAGVITATRGEGGGNATGRELGPALGMVREAEERLAMAALGIDLVYYLDELDWAFTTSSTATEQFWGYEEPLSRLVRYFRVMKPDVVITMNPSPGSGHGHHQYVSRLATEAFWLAGDPTAFPEQIEQEFIEPWQPKKLYYGLGYGGTGLQPSLAVPTNEFSPSRYQTYADVEANALLLYRSQGFDNFYTVPAPSNRLTPETFALGASVVPVPDEESDLMEGVMLDSDTAPAGVELQVEPREFFNSQGTQLTVDVAFRNLSNTDLMDLSLSLMAPEGWEVSAATEPTDVLVGDEISASFTVDIPADAAVQQYEIAGHFTATDTRGVERFGSNPHLMEVTPPVTVELQPIEAVQIYREWTRSIGMENLLTLAATQIAIGADDDGTVPVILNNRSNEDREVTLTMSVGGDLAALDRTQETVTVPAGESVTVDFMATTQPGTAQAEFEVVANATYGNYDLSDVGTMQVVPTTTVARAATAPTIDGDISEFEGMMSLDIPFNNLWQGFADDAADLSATFGLMYDDEFLYVAVNVTDETLVSNIAPNDIKGHWRTDSVEITVDPQGPGVSEHTLTTFKTGIFPFDTEGNVQAERDADANQGVISETAPDMQVASARTDNGYILEVAIPWNAVPGAVEPGEMFGFNVLLYDCDNANAAIGENCGEARTAWSAWRQIQGNPRLWGHALLQAS